MGNRARPTAKVYRPAPTMAAPVGGPTQGHRPGPPPATPPGLTTEARAAIRASTPPGAAAEVCGAADRSAAGNAAHGANSRAK
jgi:hypothetical protein